MPGPLSDLSDLTPAPYLALVVLLAVVAQTLAWRIRVPSILLLLIVGFGLGQMVQPDEVLGRDVLFAGVSLAVGIILFEGASSLHVRDLRDVGRPVLRLCSVTPLIAWSLASGSAWIVGVPWELALLVGAILVVTGPTVIGPILRTLRPTRRVASLLRWEGIVVDPLGAILAVLVFQGVVAGGREGTFQGLAGTLALTVVVAAGLAVSAALLIEVLFVRHVVPDHLQGVTCVAAAMATQTLSNEIQNESGLLTVTVLGVVLGNRRRLHLRHVAEFTEHLQVLLVGMLFVILAGRVSPSQLGDVAPQAAVFVALLVLVVRPVSVLIGLTRTDASRAERTLLAAMAPRGIVAAAVTSIFALELTHTAEHASASGDSRAETLERLAEGAQDLVPLVFLVIVVTVALYGLGVGRLAERLGLAKSAPQDVLFVGGEPWVVEAARRLKESGFDSLIVATDYRDLTDARNAGLRTVATNILSDYAVRDMDLAGIGRLIATTENDEANSTAAREFAHVLDRVNVFALLRSDVADAAHPEAERRKAPAGHLTARVPFSPAVTHDQLTERMKSGWRVTRTLLTEEFGPDDLNQVHGPEAVHLFAIRGTTLEVVTERTELTAGTAVLALVPPAESA